MGTPAAEKDEATQNGVSYPALVISLFGVLIIGLGAAGYVVLSDRVNGQDAWRTTELRSQRNDAKAACQKNVDALQELHEWVRQNPTLKPPIDGMKQTPCPEFKSIDNKEH